MNVSFEAVRLKLHVDGRRWTFEPWHVRSVVDVSNLPGVETNWVIRKLQQHPNSVLLSSPFSPPNHPPLTSPLIACISNHTLPFSGAENLITAARRAWYTDNSCHGEMRCSSHHGDPIRRRDRHVEYARRSCALLDDRLLHT